MAQVIIYTNENGGVSVTYPSPEFLETNTIEDVMVKDCPEGAIIVDDSTFPTDKEYFNAWELIDGEVVVNEVKKQAIFDAKQEIEIAKTTSVNKLKALGLTDAEIQALKGVA